VETPGGRRRNTWPPLWAVVILMAALPLLRTGAHPAGAAVPEPQFAPYASYPAGFYAESIAVADFTGDGRKDIVGNSVWHIDPARGFKLFLFPQQADGSFTEGARLDMVPYEYPHYVTTLDAGDLDGDGRADVAVGTPAGIDVFLQRDGGLAPRLPTPAPGTMNVKLADIDGDGRLDALTSGTNGVSWLRGAGDGTFGTPVAVSASRMLVETGHFNRDGRLDIVGVDGSTLYVYRQLADGSFSATATTSVGDGGIAVGDLNNDGLDDVALTVASNRPSSSVSVRSQRPDGSLGPAVFYPAYDIPKPLAIVDVNGDGRKDVVTVHDGWYADGVLLQDTDGHLTTERLYSIPYINYRGEPLAVEDVSGDGRPDIVQFAGDRFLVQKAMAPLPPTTTSSTPTSSTTSTTAPPTTTTTAPRPVVPDEATSWQIDPAHSGGASGGSQRPPLSRRWSRDLGGRVSYPLIAGGRVFALAETGRGSQGTTLFALDAATGRDLWGPLDLGASAFFAYGEGQVFVLNADGVLRSFDAVTGRQRWIVLTHPSTAPPVYKDGILYLTGVYNSSWSALYGISAVDGHELFERFYAAHDAGPAVADDLVFTSIECGPDSGWSATTGDLVWSTPTACYGSAAGNRTPVVGAGLVWDRSVHGRLPEARDARTGALVTSFTADVAPAFDATQGYFLDRGVLEAREPATQQTLWRFTGDGQLTAAPIVVNGYVYAASATGQVWALDARTGAVTWTDNAGSPVLPPLDGGFRPLYVALSAGQGIVAVPATNHLVAYASAAPPAAMEAAPVPAGRAPFSSSGSNASSGLRIDNTHQGNLVSSTVGRPPLRKRWTRDLGYPADYSVVADGRMFVAAGPKLFALDLVTGQDLWPPITLGSEQAPRSYVSYGDGRLFASFREGPLRAIEAATGRELWSRTFSQYGSENVETPTAYDNGVVYAVTSVGLLRALSAATGAELWAAHTGGGMTATPTVSGGLVTVGCAQSGTTVNASTGAVVWRVAPSCGGQSAVSAGELWGEATAGTPLVREAATGRLLGAASGTLPAFDQSRTYALEGSAVKGRERSTGFTQWTFVGDGQLTTPPVVVNDAVYVGSATGRLWALDPATGTELWADDVGAPVRNRWPFIEWSLGANIVAGQGVVAVPASNLMVAYEPVPAPGGGFHSLTPARLLDTRSGLGAPRAKVGPGGTLTLQVTGRGGVPPTGVSAVALNVTVTGPTAQSFLTAWPAGETRPLASNLNYLPGQTVANMAMVKVGQGGGVNLYNNLGSTDVVVDVAGWYGTGEATQGARYASLPPSRILDTRSGVGAPVARVGPGSTLSLQVAGQGGVPLAGASAVALNVTVTGPSAESFLTAWPAGVTRPLASNLNYVPGQTVPNLVIVRVGDGGRVNLYNNLGATDVVVDVAGWFDLGDPGPGPRYVARTPARILDTRSGLGAPAAKVGPGGVLSLQVTGRGGLPATGVSAVVLNVTVTGPTAQSFLTAWPTGRSRPLASNLNYLPGQTVPNMAIVQVGEGGRVDLFNYLGATDIVVDVAGWYSA
jgi:outer membrane protein assembly factor BamB